MKQLTIFESKAVAGRGAAANACESDPPALHAERSAVASSSSATAAPSASAAAAATSREARRRIDGRADSDRKRVLEFLRRAGRDGATDEQIQSGLRLNPSSERPRRGELVEAGAVVPLAVTRKTASGRAAVVWCAAEYAS